MKPNRIFFFRKPPVTVYTRNTIVTVKKDDEDRFILKNENGQTLTLTGRELSLLVRDISRLLDPQALYKDLETIKPDDILVRLSKDQTKAVLDFLGSETSDTAFEIRIKLAKAMAEALSEKIDQIEAVQG